MTVEIKTVTGPNPWGEDQSEHACYFCKPMRYPPMPDFHTLCARCGQLISTRPVHDPRNMAMFVCSACEDEMIEQERAGSPSAEP